MARYVVLVLLAGVLAWPGPVSGEAGAKPNVVIVLMDDLDATVSPYWDAMPFTRSLIADRGVTFPHAFVPTPICCPGRASLLTGQYGHNTGVLTNGGARGGMQAFNRNGNHERTVAVALRSAGYRTAFAGKYMNGHQYERRHVAPGWDDWNAAVDPTAYAGYGYFMNENGRMVPHGAAPNDYLTDVVADKLSSFVEREAGAAPLFVLAAPTAPHFPIPPAPRHTNHPFAGAAVPKTPNYAETDLSDKPSWLQESGDGRRAHLPWTEIDFRNRMGSLYAVDEMVERIARALEAAGELDDTYFVFTSDNGYNNGSHRLIHKMAPYDESIRIPLAISGPRIAQGERSEWALMIDLAPTILEWAGAEPLADPDGRSLVPLLEGADPGTWRTDFLAQYVVGGGLDGLGTEGGLGPALPAAIWHHGTDIPSYRALRTADHLYVEWYEDADRGGVHEYELYDMRSDPYQLQNLLAPPRGRQEHADSVRTLHARMLELASCAAESCRS